jgi:hypothetical protein
MVHKNLNQFVQHCWLINSVMPNNVTLAIFLAFRNLRWYLIFSNFEAITPVVMTQFVKKFSITQTTLAIGISPVAPHYQEPVNTLKILVAKVPLLQPAAMASRGQKSSNMSAFGGVMYQYLSSGIMSAQEDVQSHDAFSLCAAASGWVFEEVQDDVEAFIVHGFYTFDIAHTGQIGYPDWDVHDQDIQDALIYLLDPTQAPFEQGVDDGLYYNETQGGLGQVLLHEISHALGLDKIADATSTIYYYLGSNNRQINATEPQGIKRCTGRAQRNVSRNSHRLWSAWVQLGRVPAHRICRQMQPPLSYAYALKVAVVV